MRRPCWQCGTPVSENSPVCGSCGTPTQQPSHFRCPECDTAAERTHVYCTGCGTQIQPCCSDCDRPMQSDWSFCPACGGEAARPEDDRGAALSRSGGTAYETPDKPPPAPGPEAERANKLGVSAFENERFDEALEHFEEAVRWDPGNVEYLLNTAVTQGELGLLDSQEDLLNRVLQLSPCNSRALLYLGEIALEREQPAVAREYWEQVIQAAPESEEATEARENLDHLDQL